MPKRSSIEGRQEGDVNQLAKAIVDEATSDEQPEAPAPEAETPDRKNPAAVALGRLGGKKGGPARAKKLSQQRRKEIAKKAAETRWGKKRD